MSIIEKEQTIITMITNKFIEKTFPKGKLTLIGGHPAMGKTSFAISLTISLAELNRKCIYFSAELKEQQLVERYKLQIDIEEYNIIAGNIIVDDTSNINTKHIRKSIEHYQPDYVIVDYIQLMSSNNQLSDRNTEMQAIVQELKTLASDCNIPIIGLSQLNRCQNDTSCFLNPNNYRELPLDYLEDINLTCIYRGDYFKKYEYDSNGEVIYGKTRFIIYHNNSPEIIYLLFNYETKGFSMFPSVMYIHGLSSSGASSTAINLRKLLPKYDVLSPDLPIQPQEALTMLKDLCELYKPEIIIGTSMGGMFAQQLRGYKKILVNPAFHVSEFMRTQLGVHDFLNPRKSGETKYEITSDLCDSYQLIEANQFADITDFDIKNTYALFGIQDTLVHGYDEYIDYYRNAMWFEGEHRLNFEVIKNIVVPLVKIILRL